MDIVHYICSRKNLINLWLRIYLVDTFGWVFSEVIQISAIVKRFNTTWQ